MYGWMDREDRWMVGCIVKNRWMGGRKDKKQKDGWTDINKFMKSYMDGWMDIQIIQIRQMVERIEKHV